MQVVPNTNTRLDVAKAAEVLGHDHFICPCNGQTEKLKHVSSGAALKVLGGFGEIGRVNAGCVGVAKVCQLGVGWDLAGTHGKDSEHSNYSKVGTASAQPAQPFPRR
jgi:hypothetical protein